MLAFISKLESNIQQQVKNRFSVSNNNKFDFRLLLLLILSILLIENTRGQESQVAFNILKKDRSIGVLQIQKTQSSSFTDYQVSTKVEVSFIKKFRVHASESSRYKNDRLIYSEVNRTINDKPKGRKELKFSDNKYVLMDGDQSRVFNEPEIRTNLVKLYFSKPQNVDSVYCDNQQMMIDLEKLSGDRYRLQFPNGVSNVFHYKSGKCVQVDVEGTFFQVSLLKK